MSQPPKIPRHQLLILAFAYGLGVGYDPEHPPPFPLGPLIDAFGKGLRFGHDGEDIVVDAPKWITMHPNGKDAKGQHVQIETTTGEVLCGLGEENKGKTLEEINGKPKPASTGSSGGPVSVGFSNLEPAVVADIKRKNFNSLSNEQSRHLDEALSALCDTNWDAQAVEPQLKFQDRAQQRRFDMCKRDAFAYDALKVIGGTEGYAPLDAETVRKGEAAARAYAAAIKQYYAQNKEQNAKALNKGLDKAFAFLNGKSEEEKAQLLTNAYYKAYDACDSVSLKRALKPAVDSLIDETRAGKAFTPPDAAAFFGNEALRNDFMANASVALIGYIKASRKHIAVDPDLRAAETALKGFPAKQRSMLLASEGCSDVNTAITRIEGRKAQEDEWGQHSECASATPARAPKDLSKAIEEAEAGRCNPNHHTDIKVEIGGKLVNPFHINCQACVVAFEMRYRGENVVARPFLPSAAGNSCQRLAQDATSIWKNRDTKAPPDVVSLFEPSDVAKIVQEGQRFCLQWHWSSRRGGHILNAMRLHGEIIILDPQSGQKYSLADWSGYMHDRYKSGSLKAFRIDNCDIIPKYANQVLDKATS